MTKAEVESRIEEYTKRGLEPMEQSMASNLSQAIKEIENQEYGVKLPRGQFAEVNPLPEISILPL